MVGEVFDADPALPSYFQGGVTRDGVDTGIDSVFDFATYFAIRDVFAHGKDIAPLPQVLANDRLYANPSVLVPFAGNHDVKRFMSEPGATLDGLKLAFTYLLTTRGTPEIYYGDELAMTGGDDPDNRHDFPAGDPTDNEMFRYVQRLLSIRRDSEALRRGTLSSLLVDTHTWIYVRESASEHAIIAINNGPTATDLDFEYLDGNYAAEIMPGVNLHIDNHRGRVHLTAHSAEIFKAVKAR